MSVNVCPADKVHAPVEVIWELLMQPAGYGNFWDMTIERVEPEGPAAVGQKLMGWTRATCRRWQFAGEIMEVDAVRHQIQFRMSLPLGLISDNRIVCTPLDERNCMLRYG
jgi:hypothetical protein